MNRERPTYVFTITDLEKQRSVGNGDPDAVFVADVPPRHSMDVEDARVQQGGLHEAGRLSKNTTQRHREAAIIAERVSQTIQKYYTIETRPTTLNSR